MGSYTIVEVRFKSISLKFCGSLCREHWLGYIKDKHSIIFITKEIVLLPSYDFLRMILNYLEAILWY